MTACSSVVARASASCQSTDDPSATDSASGSNAVSDFPTTHFLCQAQQRAGDRHPGRVGRWLAERLRDILIRAVHFNAHDDGFAILGTQSRQRRFIALHGFVADRGVE